LHFCSWLEIVEVHWQECESCPGLGAALLDQTLFVLANGIAEITAMRWKKNEWKAAAEGMLSAALFRL
jgi:hypothetical protein